MVVHICEAIAKSNRELLEVVTDARISERFQEFWDYTPSVISKVI